MKRIALLLLAAASFLASHLHGAGITRPRYGDQLRMEIRAQVSSLDPGSRSADLQAGAAKLRLMPLIYEALVQFDDQGSPQPKLAVSWKTDAQQTRWEFTIRPGVKFHDGTLLTPALAASSLSAALADRRVSATKNEVVVEADQPMPDLLWELADPVNAIVFRDSGGKALGTGPFQVADWQVSKGLLESNQSHWGGRPFLDGISLEMGRNFRDQLLDLELGKADLVELAPQEPRRSTSSPASILSSAPIELLALVFNRLNPAQQEVRKALALSIDRAAIHAVLVQRHGEIADGLLPAWLSGYAFLFSAQTESAVRPPGTAAPVSLVLAFDGGDPLVKSTADRIAIDARKAGIMIRPAANPGANADCDLRLVRARISAALPARALIELAAALGVGDRLAAPHSSAIDEAYAMERSLLDDHGVIPLLHLPEMYAAAARVRSWNTSAVSRTGNIHLEDIWLIADKL